MKSNEKGRIRVSIIGAGRIVEYAHLPILSRMPDVSVVGLFDTDQVRAKALAERYSSLTIYSCVDDLLAAPADVVLVACPNYMHASMSIAALRANFHVLCEKPMATSVVDAHTMVEAAKRADRQLMIAFANRFRPEVVALKNAIQEGQCGQIKAIRCGWLRHKGVPGINSWFTNQQYAGGGALIDLGSHLIDLLLWFSGQYQLLAVAGSLDQTVDAQSEAQWYRQTNSDVLSPCDVEVGASGFFVLAGPLNTFIEASWACSLPQDKTYMTILGDCGSAQLETVFGFSPAGERPRYPLRMWKNGQSIPCDVTSSDNLLLPYQMQWEFFLDSIRNGVSLHAELPGYVATTQLIQALYEVARQPGLHYATSH